MKNSENPKVKKKYFSQLEVFYNYEKVLYKKNFTLMIYSQVSKKFKVVLEETIEEKQKLVNFFSMDKDN
jgi:hypothetical protein